MRRFQIDGTVFSMAMFRILSASIEFTAALLMLYFNDVRKALFINSMLAIVGPLILIVTMTIGVVGLADELSFGKILLILVGIGFILIGIFR
ncbi:YqhV family protein [Pseudalkalibacillus caeni]|uniref:DUF2619 domain-containing protein n=1 Tax=Exobacillus caeni TaxID=2574798 RepID=A0A5R9F790_9BACL|nr:YqhV family protein [Pseudalkalibacillus caeni]TLS36364.1 DUF2619 domain-containing protein [Pseudalkalibacillus caeni]